MLSRMFSWTCINISASSRLFPIVDLSHVFTCSRAEKMSSPSAFVPYESKSNVTIFSTLLIKKRLFRDMSYSFIKMVLMPIVLLSLSSNEFGNSFTLLAKSSSGKIFVEEKYSSLWKYFVIFPRRKFSPIIFKSNFFINIFICKSIITIGNSLFLVEIGSSLRQFLHLSHYSCFQFHHSDHFHLNHSRLNHSHLNLTLCQLCRNQFLPHRRYLQSITKYPAKSNE